VKFGLVMAPQASKKRQVQWIILRALQVLAFHAPGKP